jgi:hypothetical protein
VNPDGSVVDAKLPAKYLKWFHSKYCTGETRKQIKMHKKVNTREEFQTFVDIACDMKTWKALGLIFFHVCEKLKCIINVKINLDYNLADLPTDMLLEIAKYLDVRLAGRMRRVNQRFNKIIDPASHCRQNERIRLQRINRLRYHNPLWELVTKYPNKPWDWYALSQNPDITFNIVFANLDKPWNWACLSAKQR